MPTERRTVPYVVEHGGGRSNSWSTGLQSTGDVVLLQKDKFVSTSTLCDRMHGALNCVVN
jgi:hypothetical protein